MKHITKERLIFVIILQFVFLIYIGVDRHQLRKDARYFVEQGKEYELKSDELTKQTLSLIEQKQYLQELVFKNIQQSSLVNSVEFRRYVEKYVECDTVLSE